jgi:hypothetical protein
MYEIMGANFKRHTSSELTAPYQFFNTVTKSLLQSLYNEERMNKFVRKINYKNYTDENKKGVLIKLKVVRIDFKTNKPPEDEADFAKYWQKFKHNIKKLFSEVEIEIRNEVLNEGSEQLVFEVEEKGDLQRHMVVKIPKESSDQAEITEIYNRAYK